MIIVQKHTSIIKLVSLLLVAVLVVVAGLLAYQSTSHAADLSKFDPGNIMSDAVMSDKSTMSVQQIQAFLDSKNACNNTNVHMAAWYPSLNYNIKDGKFVCMAKESFGGESAAQIIWQTAQDYSINPQVLIVLLEKEQGLISDTWPNHRQYETATGFGCPDTAPCDTQYFGLKNQLRLAANLFRTVLNGGWSNYPVGNNYVQFNPNAGCGGTVVNIQNRATSALYRYTPYQPNASALAAGYGIGDGCGAYGNRNFYALFTDWFGSTQKFDDVIKINSVSKGGNWSDIVTNFGVTGSTGASKPLDAFRISQNADYTSYNSKNGWQPTVNGGMPSGLVDQGTPLQAIKIVLTKPMADAYDVWYRVHVSNVGWMGWVKNGEVAGVTGGNNSIEAIEVKVTPKGYLAPGPTTSSTISQGPLATPSKLQLQTTSHVQYVGWQPEVIDGMITGTTGQSKQTEAIKLSLKNETGISGGIVYSAHLQGIGWQEAKHSDEIAGTVGQSRRLEAIRISLTGDLASQYDIWYRVHVAWSGWQGWAKNYSPAGSVGMSRAIEAIETRILPKNSSSLAQSTSLINPSNQQLPDSYSLSYSSHVQYLGWTSESHQNQVGGTTGRSLGMEAIKFTGVSSDFGDLGITCSTYIKNTDWQNGVQTGDVCGTSGQSKTLESIKLSLVGEAANRYDIHYKIHVSFLGWQDWVKNGEPTGSPGSGRNIEAIIIKLSQK